MANTYTDVQARELDFVTRFADNWDALKNILGIMRDIKKVAGTQLISYTAQVTDGLAPSPAAGEEIPVTDITVQEYRKDDLTVEKYAKQVTIEEVNRYGAEIAIQKTDDAFLVELQNNVLTRFYNFLHTGQLTDTATTFQMALAKAKGLVLDKFNRINKTVTDIVAFVNVLDVYEYIGAANITIQTQFGLQYVKDFMGYSTVFLLSAPNVERGKVYATAVENIDLYHIDPADSDFAKLGLEYRADGETNLIGFHAEGNYKKAVGESYALLGMALWAEYIDGISVVTVTSNDSGV